MKCLMVSGCVFQRVVFTALAQVSGIVWYNVKCLMVSGCVFQCVVFDVTKLKTRARTSSIFYVVVS